MELLGPEGRADRAGADHRQALMEVRQAKELHLALMYLSLFRLNLDRARWNQDATKTLRSLGICRVGAALRPA